MSEHVEMLSKALEEAIGLAFAASPRTIEWRKPHGP